jgi:hypothetical protein
MSTFYDLICFDMYSILYNNISDFFSVSYLWEYYIWASCCIDVSLIKLHF